MTQQGFAAVSVEFFSSFKMICPAAPAPITMAFLVVRAFFLPAGPLQGDVPVSKPYRYHQQELGQAPGDVVGDGHPPEEAGDADHLEPGGQQGGREDPVQLAEAGEAPDAVVEPQEEKHRQAEHGVEGGEPQERVQVFRRDRGVAQVEAQEQAEEVGGVHCHDVVEHQVAGDDLPVLQEPSLLRSGSAGIRLCQTAHGPPSLRCVACCCRKGRRPAASGLVFGFVFRAGEGCISAGGANNCYYLDLFFPSKTTLPLLSYCCFYVTLFQEAFAPEASISISGKFHHLQAPRKPPFGDFLSTSLDEFLPI